MAHWIRVLASYYTGSGGGACGFLQDGHYHYAELGTATLGGVTTGYGRLADKFGKGGELPCGYGLYIRYHGKATYATKADRGYGNPSLGIHDQNQRDIDLYGPLAVYLGMTGVDFVEVTYHGLRGAPPVIIPQQGEPSVGDYDWSPYLRESGDAMQLHGERARSNADYAEWFASITSYCTTDGPR